jgi:hypothetical protein
LHFHWQVRVHRGAASLGEAATTIVAAVIATKAAMLTASRQNI